MLHQLPVRKFPYLASEALHKPSIMGDGDDGAGKPDNSRLECFEDIKTDEVRGLIKQENVWPLRHQASDLHFAPLPNTQLPKGFMHVLEAEQAIADKFGHKFRLVAYLPVPV